MYSVLHKERFSSIAFMQNEGNVSEIGFWGKKKKNKILICLQVKQFTSSK